MREIIIVSTFILLIANSLGYTSATAVATATKDFQEELSTDEVKRVTAVDKAVNISSPTLLPRQAEMMAIDSGTVTELNISMRSVIGQQSPEKIYISTIPDASRQGNRDG